MTVSAAAIQVLKEAGRPLHAKEITERILSRGLWSSSGKTPGATVSARLYSDIKKNGEASHFLIHAPGTFGLRAAKPASDEVIDTQREAAFTKTQGTPVKTYSFTESAEKVLETFGNGQPMHYREVTKRALKMGCLITKGKTPEASMYAGILAEIERYKRRGEVPRFIQHGKGFVGLSKWTVRGLASEIKQHNKKVRRALHRRLLALEWREFEWLVQRIMAEIGFEEIEVTSGNKDGGIDVRGTLVVGDVIRTRMAIQVKKWMRNVQAPIVQQVRGSLGTHEQGLIITTSDFSDGAREEAARPDATPVALMNGGQFVLLLVEHGIGVKRQKRELLDLDEKDLSDKEYEE